MVTQPEASTEAVEPKGLWPGVELEVALGGAGAALPSGSDWQPVTKRAKRDESEKARGVSFIE